MTIIETEDNSNNNNKKCIRMNANVDDFARKK